MWLRGQGWQEESHRKLPCTSVAHLQIGLTGKAKCQGCCMCYGATVKKALEGHTAENGTVLCTDWSYSGRFSWIAWCCAAPSEVTCWARHCWKGYLGAGISMPWPRGAIVGRAKAATLMFLPLTPWYRGEGLVERYINHESLCQPICRAWPNVCFISIPQVPKNSTSKSMSASLQQITALPQASGSIHATDRMN